MIRSAISPKPRLSKCKVCRTSFEKRSMAHITCSPACALELAAAAREKKAKADYRARKEAVKSRADWLKEAQDAVNAYVRERDAALPCISCGRHHQGQYHAGHYLSRGARPELRFNLDNIHKQCAPCNNHLSGNAVLYRVGLIAKIGLERVEALEGPQEPAKYTIDDAKAIKALYRAKLKELKGSR